MTHDDRPVGATWMSCCLLWEEDENTVDYSSHADGGYRHWSGDCRRAWTPEERQQAYTEWRARSVATVTVELRTSVARMPDGRVWGARVHSSKLLDTLFVMNRETDQAEELRPYRPGMLREVLR